jgi:tyrosine-protein kinase Etk/Wzc
MNIESASEHRTTYPGHPDRGEEFNLAEMLGNLWDGRWLIIGALFLCVSAGLVYVFSVTPVYQLDGLLQTEAQKSYGAQGQEFTKMEGVYAQQTVAQAEIEILRSNLVLGRVVSILNMDLEAEPILTPVVGPLIQRHSANRPMIEVESLELPDSLRGTVFKLVARGGGEYTWLTPDGMVLGKGRIGEKAVADYLGSQVKLKIRALGGKPGQAYSVKLTPVLEAIAKLRLALTVEERGRNANMPSNILGVSLLAPNPVLGARILNEVLNQYIRQAIERKSGESSKALDMLLAQRPVLQAQLSEAEGRLNGYRQHSGAVDTQREGEVYLQAGSNIDAQITTLRQRRQELLRTYTEKSDQVTTIDQQIAHLQGESRRVAAKVTELPRAQQEVVRLTRDVQLKSEAYTTLQTSIQQLQNTLAGSLGNARVVDYAIPDMDAVKPRKKVLMALFGFIGILLGVGAAYLRKMLQRGIEDHRVIESKLGLPVLVTIPHTEAQRKFTRDSHKHLPGHHLLAVGEPEDMATESLRSLRTVLHFTMEGVDNRLVMITGPAPGVGKSFISTNLAAVLAQGGARVLLVDADLRRGSLHRSFGIKGRAGGLAESLLGRADWQTMVKETGIPDLDLLSTGVLPSDPLVLLMSPLFGQFTAKASAEYDFVIVDAPPLLPVTDALVIGSKVDTILLVAKYGMHPLDEIRTCQTRLGNLGGRLKGCVFNDIRLVGYKGLYGYYKYEFDYKYRRGEG